MAPYFEANDSGYYRMGDSIYQSEFTVAHFRRSYFSHVCPSKFTIPSIFSRRRLFFNPSVQTVFDVGSKVKVSWIDAKLIIRLRTIMKDVLSFRDWSTMKNPRCNMTPNSPTRMSLARHASIPSRITTCCPQPTDIGLFYFLQKSCLKRFGKTLRCQVLGCNIWLHNQFVWLCHALGCFSTAKALFIIQEVIKESTVKCWSSSKGAM